MDAITSPIESSNSSDANDDAPIESLVAGRARRANAGNRMGSLLSKGDGNDAEFESIFAEAEEAEDLDFEDLDEVPSDVDVASSSDDEDRDAAAMGGELEGEKELQTVERTERKRKRKGQETFKVPRPRPRGLDNNRKTLAAGSAEPVARPKKKSERVSWLPTTDDGPTRASSRKQTMQNKKAVHQRMEENEKKRRQQIEVMEAAARRKEASKPKAMTQADRLAEAARTERQNSKTLNRWEAAEQKRLEERKSKLAALQNRHLEGPVMGFWSGPSHWVDGRLVAVGARNIPEVRRAGRKDSSPKGGGVDTPRYLSSHVAQAHDETIPEIANPIQPATGTISTSPIEVPITPGRDRSGSSNLDVQQMLTGPQDVNAASPKAYNAPSTSQNSIIAEGSQKDVLSILQTGELSTKNLVVLENIDGNALKAPELQNHVLLNRRKGNAKLMKTTQELCAITGLPARFRDPKTGLCYANAYAYAEIQRLKHGGPRWSDLLGCYMGGRTGAARGVPESFQDFTKDAI